MLWIIIVGLLFLYFLNRTPQEPPPVVFYQHTFSASGDCQTACQNIPGSTTLYSETETIGGSVFLYKNQELTEPADNNCYAKEVLLNGTLSDINYQVNNGLGQITNSQYC
jgi:hypothetical protein